MQVQLFKMIKSTQERRERVENYMTVTSYNYWLRNFYFLSLKQNFKSESLSESREYSDEVNKSGYSGVMTLS